MIVVDTSAIVAILLDEIEAAALRAGLSRRTMTCACRPMTDYEAPSSSSARYGAPCVERYEALFDEVEIVMVGLRPGRSRSSLDAYRRFGKGNHPAGLNFGDCAAYALAKRLDAPLLFKGNDFARTDIRRAL